MTTAAYPEFFPFLQNLWETLQKRKGQKKYLFWFDYQDFKEILRPVSAA
jgi:hypothetical protein